MGYFGQSETPTEKHRDAVVGHLDYLLELAACGKYSEYVTIEMLKTLRDMADYVYDRQIEQEHRDRQYQAAEDAMDEICTDPDMW
ncbi:hypothetical protein 035JT004_219 [Bacillus phage 035JT004]|nr:hypothetical protein 035JT004_219 [Bacillus phage 035JT004]